ncbi:MAG: NfeD family protein [Spirochaetota bacterium]
MRRILCLLALMVPLSAATNVYHIAKLEYQVIDKWYAHYIETQYKKAKDAGASLIVFELDTPGGYVVDALKIKGIIMDSPVDTAVFVNRNAISAGALISLSAKYIYLSRGAVIGAATPVLQASNSFIKASEKEVSVMRAEMRSAAERHGRNPRIAEAMVDESIGLTKKVDGIDIEKGRLLTLTTDEAVRLGFVNGSVSSVRDILTALGKADVPVIKGEPTTRDRFIGFLTSPVVLMLLLAIGIIAAFVEFKTAGFGVGGSVAVLSFATFFISQFLLGDSNWMAPAIFFVGVVLIVVEVFLVPGFGIPGIVGIVLMFVGIVISFGIKRLEYGIVVLLVAIVAATIVSVFIAKKLPKSRLFSALSLTADEKGAIANDNLERLLGKTGTVIGTLRPAGQIEIDGNRYDAVSQGSFIESGTTVKVIKVEGHRVVVA